MHPFFVIALVFAVGLLFILVTAVAATAVLASVGIRQAEKERAADVKLILETLPCTDCGQCPQETCEGFANMLLDTFSGTEQCGRLTQVQAQTIDALLETRKQEAQERKAAAQQDSQSLRKKRIKLSFGKTGGKKDA